MDILLDNHFSCEATAASFCWLCPEKIGLFYCCLGQVSSLEVVQTWGKVIDIFLFICVCLCVYIFIYMSGCVCICVYVNIYTLEHFK